MLKEMIPLEDVIRILELKPLTGEGGMFAQPYASDEVVRGGTFEGRPTDRPLSTSIYYLLTPNTFSCMHRLVTDEIWYHHAGPAARMLLIYPDGRSEVKLLGGDLLNGELPQVTVPRGTWQGCMMHEAGPYTLAATSMAPGYMDSDFEAGTYEELRKYIPDDYEDLLKRLTSEPVYE